MKNLRLDVEGMTCQHCVGHVTKALTEVPGVEAVEVRLEENAATLTVGETFSEQAAAAALDEAGYAMGEVRAQ
ncbi:MAG: heavy-metal-associated domain-containing protein [SAR324 cluster bacterium]|nr:heavy-metal-associated domain-containing protein [SAR324 cluster bacterium]MCH8885559.1 heavy-metal-associated domain-containing protein [SAR324 cluster bacterium]